MDNVKKEGKKDRPDKKGDIDDSTIKDKSSLDGKRLYDLYRHMTKLIK